MLSESLEKTSLLSYIRKNSAFQTEWCAQMFCVATGIPLVIVSLVLAINKDAYGSYVSDEAAVGLGSAES